jgi:hypothetical protein
MMATRRDLEVELEVEARFGKRLEDQLKYERRRTNQAQATIWLLSGVLLVQSLIFAWLLNHKS